MFKVILNQKSQIKTLIASDARSQPCF